MPQNIFKLYDGRTSFWQWDTKQKLIVLDERVTEVRFSNRNMEHSKRRPVYTDENGVRVCHVPDLLLQLPKNLIAYACSKNEDGSCSTIKAVKFAVQQQPIPMDYVCEKDELMDDIFMRLELFESLLKEIEVGKQEFVKFANMVEAAQWALENGEAGDIVIVRLDAGWVPHVVEDNKSLSPICNCDGDVVVLDLYDGGDADGYSAEEQAEVKVWDGGGAAGY